MKNLFAICLFMASTFAVNAQELTFEDTVNYINEKIECCATDKTIFIAEKDGTFKFGTYSINVFDLYDDGKSQYGKFGITHILNIPSGITRVKFWLSELNSFELAEFSSPKDAERVYNALLHLRSLCKQAKDPFDN